MPFSATERQALLALKGVGPTVLQRLEQMGFHSMPQLAQADAREIVTTAASLLGSSCWKNSPQALAAIHAVIDAARSWPSGPPQDA